MNFNMLKMVYYFLSQRKKEKISASTLLTCSQNLGILFLTIVPFTFMHMNYTFD